MEVIHYGFRLTKPDDIDAAAAAVAKVGGKILSKGEFVPGERLARHQAPFLSTTWMAIAHSN